jgi:hypothetical protein
MTRAENVLTRKDFGDAAHVMTYATAFAHIATTKHDSQKRAMK